MSAPQSNPVITDVFVEGARKGWSIATSSTLPNVVMAFIIIKALEITGALKGLGTIFSPLMGLFGLPGEAITVLLTSWLSASAGTGVAVSLLSKGTLNVADITILIPAIFLMGSQLQYMGRLLGVADVPKKYWPLLMAVSIINAVIAMLVMRVIA